MITNRQIFMGCFLMFACMLSVLQAFAQSNGLEVTGKVTDSEGALPGVNILVKGSSSGTVTDIDGNYRIKVPAENDTLIFSSIGYASQEIPVGGRSVIDLQLSEDIKNLSEVVVVGYGTQKKRDLTGAVSQVSAERLENENPNAVQDILRGNIAGLNVGYSTSAKGGGNLEVRGKTTLNAGSSPLIVLDGAIYYGELSDINPNDIESVDVLKDASSTAVFGAKAANGVILITTKKGKSGKPTITLNTNVGLAGMSVHEPVYGPDEFVAWRSDVMRSIDVNHEPYRYTNPNNLPSDITLDEWMSYDGSDGDPETVWLQRLNMQPVEIANYKEGKSVDWYDMVFQNGLRQDHTLSLSGKKDELSYYMSLGYLDNEGIVVGDRFQTIRSRLNIEGQVNKFLSVGMNTQFADRDESFVPANWGVIRSNSPWGSEYTDDGEEYRLNPNDERSGGAHPYVGMRYVDRLQKITTLNTTLFGKVKLPLGITYQVNFTPRYEFYERYNHESAAYQGYANRGGIASRQQRKIYTWQVDNILKWNKTIGDIHNFDVTLLANAEKYQSWDNTMTNNDFDPHDRLGYHNISAGINPIVSSNDEYSTGDALMGRLFYSLKDRYLLTLSVRRDGYSAFGRENSRATFPAAALGWVFTDENFFNSSWIDYGKLRFSWGINGNRDIGRYASLADLTTGKYLHVRDDGTVYQVSQLYVNNMSNNNLRWEKTMSYNIGMDFTLFDNVLDGTVEAYHMSTTDLLVQRSLPDILGFNWVWANLGEVQNRGVELNLSSVNMNRKNFSWRSTFNFQLNRNEIISLYGDMVDVVDEQGNVIGQREADDYENEWFIGHAIDEIWDMREEGVWQVDEAEEAAHYGVHPGDFKVKDVNGDTLYTRDDKEFLGFKEPRFRWTLRNEFTLFKNIDVSFMLYSYWGHMTPYNQAKNRDGFLDRTNSHQFPYWTPDNPSNDYARLYSSNGSASFNVYRKRSFVRLDNIAIAYSFPRQLIEKASIESLRVYFNIRNVGVWSPDWTYWDPEWDPDVGPGPTPRFFTLGVNLTL
ncbi:TonB-dependent receptor [Porifericola rhodea]|uniref:SusC/RagA family TonB-linked outer membrane protein n=1 Tax=Porifericola rhodea TaxID=930972 RepID=UPI00266508C8|nr:TonB-dependent receptor [Porifericola rhodea]WKN32341.1 TonB-dependent receptor [Porifericola rhodea]